MAKLTDDVLTILSGLTINGNRVVIETPLDRKMYTRVNDALVALGGKWSRSAKAHLFDGDAQERIDVAIATGEVTTHKDLGFFPTPPHIAARLVSQLVITTKAKILEPSAGVGALVRACIDAGATPENIYAVERSRVYRDALREAFPRVVVSSRDDCMDIDPDAQFDAVAMNPPFLRSGKGDHLDHTHMGYTLLKPRGRLASILPSSIAFRQDRRHAAFRQWINANRGQIEPLPDDAFVSSGTRVRTVLLTMTKGI